MLTIVQGLKTGKNQCRVVAQDRYMFWNIPEKQWFIFKGLINSPEKIRFVAATKDQKTAVDFLLGKR